MTGALGLGLVAVSGRGWLRCTMPAGLGFVGSRKRTLASRDHASVSGLRKLLPASLLSQDPASDLLCCANVLRPSASPLTSLRRASHWQDLAGLVWGKSPFGLLLCGLCCLGWFQVLKVLLAHMGYALAAIIFIVCACYTWAVFSTADCLLFPYPHTHPQTRSFDTNPGAAGNSRTPTNPARPCQWVALRGDVKAEAAGRVTVAQQSNTLAWSSTKGKHMQKASRAARWRGLVQKPSVCKVQRPAHTKPSANLRALKTRVCSKTDTINSIAARAYYTKAAACLTA